MDASDLNTAASNDDFVSRILDVISPSTEDDGGTDEQFELIEQFVAQNPNEDLAELIFAGAVEDTEPWKVGALFDCLVWSTPNNGSALMRTMENWLRGDDPRRIEHALSMGCVFPFRDAGTMKDVFSRINSRWPQFAERCNERVERRARLPE